MSKNNGEEQGKTLIEVFQEVDDREHEKNLIEIARSGCEAKAVLATTAKEMIKNSNEVEKAGEDIAERLQSYAMKQQELINKMLHTISQWDV